VDGLSAVTEIERVVASPRARDVFAKIALVPPTVTGWPRKRSGSERSSPTEMGAACAISTKPRMSVAFIPSSVGPPPSPAVSPGVLGRAAPNPWSAALHLIAAPMFLS